ncbi:major capsid protein [Escherichia coli]|nr:major capsid protein [Escherichia coli]EJN3726837.1 major capsid protein [Escherichia coli]EJP0396227.1 major capsid protein [Escherichia coli]EJP0401407.1 major capsid protein [Escherichia coli]EJP0406645.1 major capsid protein [Escherichia coli]
MGLFTTRQLLGYTEQKVKFRALFLELFFRRTVTFHTQEVMLDKITGKTPVAAYVSPVVSGKVLRSRGGETRVLRPGYVKPKHRLDYQQAVERLPGEDPARLNDPAYRRLRILTDNLKQEEQAIVQVEEMQAVSAVLQGKYTMSGEQFETVEVDFGRSAANNITQAGGREWSKQNADTFDPTHDLDAYCDFASGTINIAIMDGAVWRMLNGFKLFREKLDTRRGSKSELETALKDLGSVVSFKGYYGDLAIMVAKTTYVDENGDEQRYLPEGTLILGNTQVEGVRCYGAIQDNQALSEGITSAIRYPKHWLEVGDPGCEYTMTQSAPLMVLPDPDAFVVVQVK